MQKIQQVAKLCPRFFGDLWVKIPMGFMAAVIH
jgi:hypothetical protein